jgi:hypothetical protein
VTELSDKLENSFRKLNADFAAYEDSHGESLKSIFKQLNICIHRCDDLAKTSARPMSSPVWTLLRRVPLNELNIGHRAI